MHIVVAPLYVWATKKKKFHFNLNVYRNSHFFTMNKAKADTKAVLKNQILALPKFNKVRLTFTLFPKTKRLCDLDNIHSIICKFFQDALVEYEKIPEDNYLFIPEVDFRFGEVDKTNPRIEIQLEELL